MNFPFRNPINKLQNSDNSNIHPQPNLFTNHLHSALTINSHKSHELLNFKNEYHLSVANKYGYDVTVLELPLSRADITLNPGRKLVIPEKLLPLATGCLVSFFESYYFAET